MKRQLSPGPFDWNLEKEIDTQTYIITHQAVRKGSSQVWNLKMIGYKCNDLRWSWLPFDNCFPCLPSRLPAPPSLAGFVSVKVHELQHELGTPGMNGRTRARETIQDAP